MIPEHTIYIEPFCGGGGVLFAKDPAKVEVINDIDGELVNFYQVVRDRHDELIRSLRWLLHSRRWFRELLQADPASLDKVERAARFFYLRKGSFGGVGKNFGRSKTSNQAAYLSRAEAVITEAHARLRRVTIEEQDFEEVLKFFDDPRSFAYLDPPYRDMSDGLYSRILADGDYERLHWFLAGAQGKWLMSHADDPYIRGIFRNFTISDISTTYSLSGGNNTEAMCKERREILICNYSAESRLASKTLFDIAIQEWRP